MNLSDNHDVTGNLAFALRLDRITQTIALAGFCGLVVVALLTFYDGGARYLGLARLSGFRDYGELAYPIVIASCFPAGLMRQSNVTIRVAEGLVGQRAAFFLEALAALITLVFFGLLVWQFVVLGLSYGASGRTTRTVEIALAPWWWIATAIMVLCVPAQAYVATVWCRAALSGRPPVLALLKSRATAEAI